MPIRMSLATAEDAPGLAAILFADWADPDPWTRICYGAIDPKEQFAHLTAVLREDLVNPEFPVVIQKAQDEETGEIVGFIQLNDCNVTPNDRGHVEDIPRPAGYNIPPIRDYYAKMSAATKRAMGDAPYLHVTEMYILKAYQRHGIGSALMKWGTDFATKRQLPMYAEAYSDGLKFYKHLGWQTVESYAVDLGLYGGDGIYTEESLRWDPPKKQE